ncbi:MAG: caspase family protein [Nitrospirales bacterium]|nr:caspase family protein [Nitrospira sp.]MDR4501530.1 caspase family protein [Nitrospirales bacterium]
MKIRHIPSVRNMLPILCVLCLAHLFSWLSPGLAQSSTSSEPVRRALLIGIGKYQGLPRLPGSKNDINLVHQVLKTQYGFADENMRILRDEDATRENVLSALEQFVSEVGPNDVAYIHYSGHGSQVEDVNGDEANDQLDETIVPHDGRTEGVPDITDDELEAIFAKLKTTNAVVVLDSCHSGTATRGLEVRVRSIPQDTRVNLYKRSAVRTRAIVPLASARYVLMSGAAANEEALDGPVDGRYHGFFTHSLFKSLQSADADSSASEVFAGAKQELKRIQNQFGRSSMPEPQLEAPQGRLAQPLFVLARGTSSRKSPSQATEVRRSWVKVENHGKDSVLLVQAVELGGAPGSVWGIFGKDEREFHTAQAQAFARVVKTQGTHSMAVVEPHGVKIGQGARATLLVPAPPSGRIPVRLRRVDSKSQAWLQAELKKRLGDVEIVGEGVFARFIVDVEGKSLRVYSADAAKEVAALPASRTADSADSLAQVLTQSRNASNLLALENPNSRIGLDVRVVQVGERGIAVVSDRMEAPTYQIRQQGQPRTLTNSLQLEISTDTDAYITIVDVDAEGSVNVLFPNPYQKRTFLADGFIKANQPVLVPDSLRSGNRAGFHFDYANPPGVDTIRVFASTDRRLAEKIRRAVHPQRSGESNRPSLSGRPGAQLASLRQELVGSLTRGLITVPDEPVMMPAQTTVPQELPVMAQAQEVVEPEQYEESMNQQSEYAEEAGLMETQYEEPSEPIAFEAIPVQQTIPDWTAASVTVLVGE